MKRFFTYVLRKMPIKTRRSHSTPNIMAKICNTESNSHSLLVQMVQALWRTALQVPTKLNILLPNESATGLLEIYPKEVKMYIHTKTCKCIFRAALFITAPNWKHSKIHQQENGLKKKSVINTMEYYMAIKIVNYSCWQQHG